MKSYSEEKQTISFLISNTEIKSLPLESLLDGLDGLNITSPYKRHFFPNVRACEYSHRLRAVNCIKKEKNCYKGAMTDFPAAYEIFLALKKSYRINQAFILGDGVMGLLSRIILDKHHIPFQIFSRKKTDNFDKLDLYGLSGRGILIINACSRDYAYPGPLKRGTFFWDYNYHFHRHGHLKKQLGKNYLDGKSLLLTQAKYAIKFLSL